MLWEREKEYQCYEKEKKNISVMRKRKRISVLCGRLQFLVTSYLGFVTIAYFLFSSSFLLDRSKQVYLITDSMQRNASKRNMKEKKCKCVFLHQIWSRGSVHINVVCISECPSFLFCMQRATYMQGKRSRWAALWSSKSPSAAAPAPAGQGHVE